MQIPNQAVSLRIFIGESDHFDGKPLYEAIAMKRASCTSQVQPCCAAPWASASRAGCTPSKILRLSEDLPLLIEIVDSEETSVHSCPSWMA